MGRKLQFLLEKQVTFREGSEGLSRGFFGGEFSALSVILKSTFFYHQSDVLQRILYRQIVPEHHTLLALIACCGDHRQVATGEAILGLMEDLQMNPNVAWCTLIGQLSPSITPLIAPHFPPCLPLFHPLISP